MDQKATQDVLLETVAQTQTQNPRTDQAERQKARSHQFRAIAQKLLAVVKNLGHPLWIEQGTF